MIKLNIQEIKTLMLSHPLIAKLEAAAEYKTTNYPLGNKLIWRIWGTGPNLLLLHGNFGAWTHWIHNIEPLSQHFRLLVPDLPGSGDSGDAPENPSFDSAGAAIATGISEIIGDAPIAIAGFSSGGIFGAAVAKILGPRVTKLVIIGSTTLGVHENILEPFAAWRRVTSPQSRREAHRRNLQIIMLHHPADELAVDIQSYNAERCQLNAHILVNATSLLSYLPNLKCKLAGIWGEYDSVAEGHLRERYDLFRRIQPESQFVVIRNAGHWLLYESPDKFNPVLIALLDPAKNDFAVADGMAEV